MHRRRAAGVRTCEGDIVIEPVDTISPRARWLLRAVALLVAVVGLLTIRAGALAIFGDVDVGTALPLVLWFNFLAGFAYLVAAVGLALLRPWAVWLSATIAVGTAIVLATFTLHVATGGAYEARTLLALSLRTAGWCAVAWLGRRLLGDEDPR